MVQSSETLQNNIFQAGPRPSELQLKMEDMLAQFSPERINSPQIQETLARIDNLTESIIDVAGETRRDIVKLYRETVIKTHLGQYESQVALLTAHQQTRVANLLGASGANDDIFTQAA